MRYVSTAHAALPERAVRRRPRVPTRGAAYPAGAGALWREGKGAAIVYQQRGKHLRRAPLRVRDACRLILRQAVTAGSALSSTNGMDGGGHFTLRLAQPRIPRPAAVHPPSPRTGSAARFDPSSSCNKARRGVVNLGRPACQEGIIRALPHRTRGGRDAHADQDHTPTGLESARRQPRPHSGQASRPGCAIRAARPPGSSEFTYRYRWAQHTRNASRLDSILVTDQLTPVLLVTGQLRLVFNMAEISPALCADDGRTHW